MEENIRVFVAIKDKIAGRVFRGKEEKITKW
jgi:hypothetical protein